MQTTCGHLKLEQIELNKRRENARKNNCECVHMCSCYRCTIHDVKGFIECNGCKFNESSKKLKNIFKEFKTIPTEELFVQIVNQAKRTIDSQKPNSRLVSFGACAETAFKPQYTDSEEAINLKFKELLGAIDVLKKSNHHLSIHERRQISEWLNEHEDIIRRMYQFPIAIRQISKQECEQIVQRVQKYHNKLMEKTKALRVECENLERQTQSAHSQAIGAHNQYQADQYRTDLSGIRNFQCSLHNLMGVINHRLQYQARLVEKTLKYRHKFAGIHSAIASIHWPTGKLGKEVENIVKAFEENVHDKYDDVYKKYEEKMAYLVVLHNDIARWF